MKSINIKNNIIKYAAAILIIASQGFVYSQTCNLTVNSPSPSQVCPGTVVTLDATASIIGANQSFDFNVGSLPSGWSVAGGAAFSAPCGAGPDGAYFWASTAGSGTPYIQTAGFDVCTGGTIVFDMRFAIQGAGSPCEGPDEQDEGVSLQYSLDNGATWIDIAYYSPDGQILPTNPGGNTSIAAGNTPFTTWGTQTIPIPPGAISGNTMFRWVQFNSSGTCCDNWGVDNIFINAGACLNANINWNTGENGVGNIAPTVTQDTCIIAEVYDNLGNFMCASTPFCFTVFTPNIDAGPDQTLVCQGGNTTVSASGGTGFTWDNGVVDAVPFVSPNGTTTYTVTGTDLNGCLATDQVDVTVVVGTPPPLDAGMDQSICLGQSVILEATGATTYSWDNGGANGQTVTPSATTTYVVTGGDGTCTVNDPITITVVDPVTPTFNAIPDLCVGATAPTLPTTSTNGISGTWSSAINTASAGTFNFTFTPTGPTCNPQGQISVTVVPIAVVDAGLDQTVCEGTQVTLTATGATNHLWDNSVTNGVAFNPPVGTTTRYIVTGSGGSVCSNTDTVFVTVVTLPIVDAGANQTVCLGQTVTLAGSGATSYTWDNSVIDGQTFTPPLGTTTYNVVGTTSGCQDNDAVEIQVVALNVPIFDPFQDICQGITVTIPTTLTSTNDITGTVSPTTLDTSVPGTTFFTFTPDDAVCNETIQIPVTVIAGPTVDAGTYTSVCIDAADIALSGTPAGGTFTGTGVTGNIFSPAQGTQTVTYTYTDPGTGCTGTDNQLITIFNLPNINAGNDIGVCEGESVTLSGSGGVSYVWDNGAINGQTFTPGVGQTTYTVTGTDANGCVNSDVVILTVTDMPIADAIPDANTGYPGLTVNFLNNSSVTTDYLWNFGNGATAVTNNVITTPNTSYDSPGTYTMVLTATNGICTDYDTVQIIILEYPEPVIQAPNVFTPNNDGSNDYFFIDATFASSISYIILNRWGNLMFEDEGINPLWDGTSKGKPVEEGVYFYKYEVIGLNGQTYTGHGSVTVIRD